MPRVHSFEHEPPPAPQPAPYKQYDWHGDWLLALVALLVIVLLLGSSAAVMNTWFYKTYSPFYDSAAYHTYLATVVGVFEERGTYGAFKYALDAQTAPLPGLEAVVLARLGLLRSPVSRLFAIQLQLIWVAALAAALYFYWFGFRRIGAWTAVAMSLPFIMFTGLFNFNGGLMDFRLDLSLYLLFSLTCVLYLMTEHTDSYGMWVAMGLAAALACLNRATAPVYLVVALGPPWAWRVISSANRARLLKQTLAMLVPVFALAFSYFAYNFQTLYYYYVVWSADANANLPWSQGYGHFYFAWRAMGAPLTAACVLFGLAQLGENFGWLRRLGLPGALARIDWKLFYIGCAPALYLAYRGAGWNPFVAMPSIFGWMMFGLAPIKDSRAPFRTPLTVIGLAAVTLACGWNLVEAPLRAQPDWPAQMSAIRGGIDTMRIDAAAKGLRQVRYTSIHLWYFHAAFIRDALIHEYGGRSLPEAIVLPDGVRFSSYRDADFATATPLDWQRLPGSGDGAKIEHLAKDARENLDYIVMPDDETVINVRKAIPHNYANLVLHKLKKRLIDSGDWEPIGEKLRISPPEAVQIYARKR
jgi:hypothetical protein